MTDNERVATARHLVVVSFFEPRPIEPLAALYESMGRFDAGLPYDVVVVVNRVSSGRLRLPHHGNLVATIERPNSGMNIGAWDHGWRAMPGYDGYLFLQDECFAKRAGWLSELVRVGNQRAVGLVGESFNDGWNRRWEVVRTAVAGSVMPGHVINGQIANRVDVYLDFLQRHGITPSERAGHLRSLVWYAGGDTLARIDGFKIGANYGECIAAEIGATKQVEAIGLSGVQVNEEPFKYFGHQDWLFDTTLSRWCHRSSVQSNSTITTRSTYRLRGILKRFTGGRFAR